MTQSKTTAADWHQVSATEATKRLGVDPAVGLSSEEAIFRQQQYGLNRLKEIPPRSPWLLLFDQFKGLLILVLIGSFEQILIYVEFALLIFPFFAVFGLFIARKKKIGESMAVRVTGYPFVPLFFLLCSLLIMIIAYINRPLESTAAVITVLIGIPIYFIWAKGMKIS